MNLQDEIIEVSTLKVEVRKRNVKSLRIGVFPPNGLVRVTAPFNYDGNLIESVVLKKMSWILRQQKKFLNQERITPREAVSGESYFFKGKKYRLIVIDGTTRGKIAIKNSTHLELSIAQIASEARRLKVINNFYRKEFQKELDLLIPELSKKVGVEVRSCSIRKMKNRWGSCNPKKNQITLNIELIKKNPACMTYIIVHELVHLIELNHNQRFKELMDKHLPNWRHIRDLLNSSPLAHADWEY